MFWEKMSETTIKCLHSINNSDIGKVIPVSNSELAYLVISNKEYKELELMT